MNKFFPIKGNINIKSKFTKHVLILFQDAGLNFIFGVLLVIASILYIVSAAQIHKLLEPLQYLLAWLRSINSEINERYGAKIVAGVSIFFSP